ncbi:MAG: family 16 glycosylhydrolase [candidate division SR1 bacterium]|nr:family 16 glycosylhydrolase [candidate division SR1 bacterium]
MKKLITIVFFLAIFGAQAKAQQTVNVFRDLFDGTPWSSSLVDSTKWYIPTWTSPTDGTYLGWTQMRCTQNSSLPSIANSRVSINLDTYNPTGGNSFYGTDLISLRTFAPGNGLIISVRARFQTPIVGGLVGGIFSFDTTTTGLHNEIDYELLSNQLNYVHTNVYENEQLGYGHPDSSWTSTSITSDHLFVIKWYSDKVQWFVDGTLVRTETVIVPTAATHFHLNIWVPGQEWPSAFNPGLFPTDSINNHTYTMLVDSVRVDSIIDALTITPISQAVAEIQFYPNPAHDQIFFNTTEKMEVEVFDMKGSLLLKKEINGRLNVSDLSPGMYSIKYMQGKITKQKKLIIN